MRKLIFLLTLVVSGLTGFAQPAPVFPASVQQTIDGNIGAPFYVTPFDAAQAGFGTGGGGGVSFPQLITASNNIYFNAGTNAIGAASNATNNFNLVLTNGLAPYKQIINVKSPPYNAVGDGAHDDWTAIQSAITAACLTSQNPVAVYIPTGNYRLTNTLALTTQSGGVGQTGNTSITELFGDGSRRTILTFTNNVGNGLEFRLADSSDHRHLSDFVVHDLALFGPGIGGTTNVTGSGYFFGFDSTIAYAGDTAGWHDSIHDCLVMGWRNGVCITNSVFFSIKNCTLTSNVWHSVSLAHADTTLLQNNLYGFPVVSGGDLSAICYGRDVSGINGAGCLSIGGECGNSRCVIFIDGSVLKQEGGNFERNTQMLIASNFCTTIIEGCRISNAPTNYQFEYHNGAAALTYIGPCYIDFLTNAFSQYIESAGIEYPIHNLLNTLPTNGVVNGTTYRAYPPVSASPTVSASGSEIIVTATKNADGTTNFVTSLSTNAVTYTNLPAVGQGLVVQGTNTSGQLVMVGTNWPSGGGSSIPSVLGVVTNTAGGVVGVSTAVPGTWIGTASLPSTAADSTWPKRTNYIAYDFANFQSLTNAGNALVLDGLDAFGSPMVKGTNWPAGGGSSFPLTADGDFNQHSGTNITFLNIQLNDIAHYGFTLTPIESENGIPSLKLIPAGDLTAVSFVSESFVADGSVGGGTLKGFIATNNGVSSVLNSNSLTTGTGTFNGGTSNVLGGFTVLQMFPTMVTNVAPANTVTPVRWFGVTNSGQLYLFPGFQ